MDATMSSKNKRSEEIAEYLQVSKGVKDLVETHGETLVQEMPDAYVQPPHRFTLYPVSRELSVPVISLKNFHGNEDSRREVLQQICNACETWGFFRIIDHGIPPESLRHVVDSAMKLHQLPYDQKMEYHGNYDDFSGFPVYYEPSCCLRRQVALNWADKFYISHDPLNDQTELLPECIRDTLKEHVEKVKEVVKIVMEGLGDALGITNHPDDSDDIGKAMWERCIRQLSSAILYYPPCPKPDVTFGIEPHSDIFTLTVPVENDVEGLQVLHKDMWVPVDPMPGSLTVNVGDTLEVLSNGRFKSANHRVVSSDKSTRVSVVCFFQQKSSDNMAPIPQVLDENNPPLYRETSFLEYGNVFLKHVVEGKSTLHCIKVSK